MTGPRTAQPNYRRRAAVALAVCAFASTVPTLAQTPDSDDRPTIESLLKDGWQVAGYTSAVDGYSAFILFRHPNQQHLVQCRAGYDVTREKRVQTNCYRLR